MFSTSSQTSSRAIIAYLCLHRSHVILKSPPELLWESRQTFQNCADLSSPLHWCFCCETKLNQGAQAVQSSWLQLLAVNHSRVKFIATSAPCLCKLGGLSRHQAGTVLLPLGSALPSSPLLTVCTGFCRAESCWNPSLSKESLGMAPLSQADHLWWQMCPKGRVSCTPRRKGRLKVAAPCPELLQGCQASWPRALCLRLPRDFPKQPQPARREQIRLSRPKSI